MAEVAVIVRNRMDGTRKNVAVSAHHDDTVNDVLQRVSSKCGIDSSRLELVLGGRRLDGATPVSDLMLGPATCLLALVVESAESIRSSVSDRGDKKEEATTDDGTSRHTLAPSFFAYCKPCGDVYAAKLRVYCDRCASSSVVVGAEPGRWSDVLTSGVLPVECTECSSPDAHARFVFKCSQCSQAAAALRHLRRPPVPVDDAVQSVSHLCRICFDAPYQEVPQRPVVDLGCHHLLCLPCFRLFVDRSLSAGFFRLQPPHGYTISCPFPGCSALVRDPHHFAVAGPEVYKEYKGRAVEAFVARAEGAVRCPHCHTGFIWESEDDDDDRGSGVTDETPLLECPHCSKEFCSACHRAECTCVDEEAATALMLEATTKNCPKCGCPTERAGGCAHMHCTACGDEWCFVCVGDWKEECQWNHWFG